MIQALPNYPTGRVEQGLKQSSVGIEARAEQDRVVCPKVAGKPLFKRPMN